MSVSVRCLLGMATLDVSVCEMFDGNGNTRCQCLWDVCWEWQHSMSVSVRCLLSTNTVWRLTSPGKAFESPRGKLGHHSNLAQPFKRKYSFQIQQKPDSSLWLHQCFRPLLRAECEWWAPQIASKFLFWDGSIHANMQALMEATDKVKNMQLHLRHEHHQIHHKIHLLGPNSRFSSTSVTGGI